VNPIYSSISPDLQASFAPQGYFVWTKAVSGYPWDVKFSIPITSTTEALS
jgi:hypothetical protein